MEGQEAEGERPVQKQQWVRPPWCPRRARRPQVTESYRAVPLEGLEDESVVQRGEHRDPCLQGGEAGS